jgi:hypothetical protein
MTYGGEELSLHQSSGLCGDVWSVSRLGLFTSRVRTYSTHCMGGWVGLKPGLGTVENWNISCSYRKFKHNSSTVQHITGRFTDRDIPTGTPAILAQIFRGFPQKLIKNQNSPIRPPPLPNPSISSAILPLDAT